MHHAALDGAGAHDGDFDDEIVEVRGLQPRQHRLLRARFDLEHADRVGALAHRVDRGILGGNVLHRERARRDSRDTMSSARRIADSMPSARQSTLSRPIASRSSLSHWMTVRSAIAAFSTGTIRSSRPRAMTKPPTCCDRWRGKPISSPVKRDERARMTGLSGSKPASRMRSRWIARPSHHANTPASRSTCARSRPKRACRRRAPRSSAGR